MPTRHASPTHTPPIPALHRWCCCTPACTHTNTSTTSLHFLAHFSPAEARVVKVPGYHGHKCESCRHPACDACVFLEVRRVDGTSAATAKGERAPWDAIGYWDRREVSVLMRTYV